MYKTLFHCSLCIIFALTSTALFAVTSFTLPDGEVLQDPTKPQLWRVPTQIGSQQKESSFTLNYIVASGQEKRAMINGHKVVVGDVVAVNI